MLLMFVAVIPSNLENHLAMSGLAKFAALSAKAEAQMSETADPTRSQQLFAQVEAGL